MVKSERCSNKRLITHTDIWRFKFVGDPQISSDGSKIVWVETITNEDKNTYESAIWMSNRISHNHFSKPARITYGKAGSKRGILDRTPRFSPDGRNLAFISNRSGKSHIWILDLQDAGEARQITCGAEGVSNITWSPDGKHIAFISRVPEQKAKQIEKDKRSKDVTVVTKLIYKMNGVPNVIDSRPKQIFMINIKSRETKQLTFGQHSCSFPSFSPDGSAIAFVSYREDICEVEMVPDLWILILNNLEIKRLTYSQGSVAEPTYSPCGQHIAFFGNLRKNEAAAKTEVLVIPAKGGEVKALTSDFDRSIGCSVSTDCRMDSGRYGPYWSHDGKFIYFTATDRGYTKIFRVSFDNCEVHEIGVDETRTQNDIGFQYPTVITSFAYKDFSTPFDTNHNSKLDSSIDKPSDEMFAIIGGSPLNPADVYVAFGVSKQCVLLSPKAEKVAHWQYQVVSKKHNFSYCYRLTQVNHRVLSQLHVLKPERLLIESSDGVEIEGWMIKPIDFESGKKYPAVVEIHGGPHSTYGLAFFHEFQLLAANGYGVFYCNPRGSLGYGEWFAQQVIGDQGGMDYQDIMSLRKYVDDVEWVDSDRIGVTGGSYGGFMTNWIVGHTHDFRAAVTQRCISNWYTKYGTSDIGFYGNRKGMGMRDLWDSENFLMERSPIRYAPNVKTPILIIHSEQDYRCPMEQAEQWYIALKRLGKTVEFVRFADENHNLSRTGKPWNRKYRLVHILRWFEEHLK